MEITILYTPDKERVFQVSYLTNYCHFSINIFTKMDSRTHSKSVFEVARGNLGDKYKMFFNCSYLRILPFSFSSSGALRKDLHKVCIDHFSLTPGLVLSEGHV